MNANNMFRWSAISVAALLTTITTTVCSADSAQAKVNMKESTFSCTTFKDEKFNVKVIEKGNTCGITVDGKKEVTVDTMDTSSPFYSIMHGLATGTSNGKKYYTIGLSNCTQQDGF